MDFYYLLYLEVSFKSAKTRLTREKQWDDLEWQEYWHSLDVMQHTNFNRSNSHCIARLEKLSEMSDKYNASAFFT